MAVELKTNNKETKNAKLRGDKQRPAFTPLSKYYREPLRALMDDYYKRLAHLESNRDRPVAWITTMVPIEILNAANVFPFYPENYAALCASRGISDELIQTAEFEGISRDLCGYATCNIGSVLSGKWAFGNSGVPKPDLLITTRLTCNIHINWWMYLSKFYNVPLFIMDAPYRTSAQYEERDIEYFIRQVKRLVRFIEDKTGNKLSRDKLLEIMALSDQASLGWSEISQSRKNIPSPLGSKDVFSLMFPMVTLAGTQEAVQFYRDISDEVKRRVNLKVGGNERHRLIWDLFPPWHDMKLWKEFDKENSVFVIDFYADAFSGRLTDPDPYMSLVSKYLFNPTLQRGIADKRKTIEKYVKEYSLDGAVFMSNRSCRYFSLGQLDIANHLRKNLNLPVLFFGSDHMDEKKHDKIAAVSQIQTFLNILANRQ